MNRFLLHLKIYGLLGCCVLIVLGQDSLSTSSEENSTLGENLLLLMIRRDGAEDTKVPKEICRLRRIVHTIRHEYCLSKRVLSYACNGNCYSYSQIIDSGTYEVERFCNCCQEIGGITRSVKLLCRDLEANAGSFKPVVMRMKIPRGCMCRPCSAGVGVKPLEIADIQDKRELWGTSAMLLS